MVFDYGNDFVGELDIAQYVRANHRVDHDLGVFGGAQLAGLAQYVLGNGQLADVVKQCGSLQPLHLILGVTHCAREPLSQHPYSLYVPAGQFIFRIDCHGQ